MIQSQGNTNNPKVFLVSDCAFGEDLKTNYAISGYQYNTFKDFLLEQNLRIDSFWRTLLVKDEIKGYNDRIKGIKAKTEQLAQFNSAIAEYGPLLKNEINELKPNLLIPTGELSFNYLTGLTGIRKFRGSVVPAALAGLEKTTKVLPILGPYPFLNQDYKLRFITRVDISKIPKHQEETPIPDNLYNIWIARNSNALRTFFERSYTKCINSGGFLVFDIETFMGIPTCSSFCFDGFESVCVPFLDPTIDLDNRVLMVDLIAKLLADTKIKKVNQNIKYDWKRNEAWGFKVANVCGDTMLAASTLYCEFPKNLGFLTSIYTDLPYFKDEGREFDPAKHKKEQYYIYNAKDSLATHQIYSQQIGELVEKGVSLVYESLVKIMPIYRKMEDRGIRIDQEQRLRLLAKYNNLFAIQELKLKTLVGSDYGTAVNPLSNQQMRTIIFTLLGYKKIRGVKTTESGLPSTDEESLETLLAFGIPEFAPSTGPEILNIIINCRKIHKVIEVLELCQYPDNRFRCEFNLAGTETGRTSAGSSTDELLYLDDKGRLKKKNLGHSLQTIGKHGFMIDGLTYGRDIRSMFVPSHGYSFVEIDLSQAEARVDAVLANNFDILSVFDGPIGIHRLTGSWVFGVDPLEIKKDVLDSNGVDRYHMAKTVRHAGERNMKANRLVMMTQRPLRECSMILNTFHKFQPEIRDVFHKDVKKAVDAPTHCLIAPNGRRRDFFDRIDAHTYNEAISQLPQSIVSDQTKFEGILKTFGDSSIYQWAHLLTEQHDGVLTEVKKGREMEFGLMYKKNVEKEIDFRTGSLIRDISLKIPAEISVGDNWNNLKEIN